MNIPTRNIAIGLCAAVMAGAGGFAVSQASSSGTTGGAGQSQGMPGGGPGGRAGGADLSALAEDLGVTESKLQEAMESSRPSTPGAPPKS